MSNCVNCANQCEPKRAIAACPDNRDYISGYFFTTSVQVLCPGTHALFTVETDPLPPVQATARLSNDIGGAIQVLKSGYYDITWNVFASASGRDLATCSTTITNATCGTATFALSINGQVVNGSQNTSDANLGQIVGVYSIYLCEGDIVKVVNVSACPVRLGSNSPTVFPDELTYSVRACEGLTNAASILLQYRVLDCQASS